MRRRFAVYLSPILLIGWLGIDSATEFLPQAKEIPERHLVDVREAPFSSIGRLKAEITCTASAVIHPRILVTAAHCVLSREQPVVVASVAYQPSYPENAKWVEGRVVRHGRDLSPQDATVADEADDWAIIVLDTALSEVRPLALRVVGPSEFRGLQGRVTLPSYSADVAGGALLSAVERCSIRDRRWDVLIHDCPCAYGSSGAPLIVASGDGYAIVGINSAMLHFADGRVLHAAVSAASFADAVQAVVASLDENRETGSSTALGPPRGVAAVSR